MANSNVYKDICDLSTIMEMYDNVIRKNTRNKMKVEEFENYYSQNIVNIKEVLCSKKYIPGRYSVFMIREPKLRVIMSQSMSDKVVNHLVAKYILVRAFDKSLIETNCATRIGKGTHYGLRLFKKYINVMKNKYKVFYILKFDISKYFYNIDHNIVKKMIAEKVKDKDAVEIMNRIIDTTNLSYVNDDINHLKKIEYKKVQKTNVKDKVKKLNEIINIPLYEKDKGFPIGNMTSQIIATFYLNELDHYIKEKLKIKYYIRYMDDGVLIHHDKEYLKYCLEEINKIVNNYNLVLNRKTRIYSSKDQIEFLGFKFIIKNRIIMKVKNQTKHKFKRKLNKMYKLYDLQKITFDELRSVRDSYVGHLKHGNFNSLLFKNIR